jgi:hypothetical protein
MALKRSLFAAATLGFLGPAAAQTAQDAAAGWPRQIDSVAGTIVVYQPQPEALEGSTLSGRAAFSLTPRGKPDPVYGALWFTDEVATDRSKGIVNVMRTQVTHVRLPDATANDEKSLAAEIEREASKLSVSIPLDELKAALKQAQDERTAAAALKSDPPKILVASEPTVLVVLDGQPVRRPIKKTGIESVVNTPFPIFYEPESQLYYLTNGLVWYQTNDLLHGAWTVIPKPPQSVLDVVMKGDKQDQSAPAPQDTTPSKILVATEPTELIVTQGAPNFALLNGTQLLYVTNSEENIFRDLTSQQLFIVLSGRWYSGPALEGPWAFVPSDMLPADFAKIPPSSAKGDVLAFVPGTSQAKDAVLDAQIPTTAQVRRDAPGPSIQYDGAPNFQPVPGTGMSSAANTPASVLLIHGLYYACVDAVWYVGEGPQGPWTVATSVPKEVQTIPPSSPLYNVKYVTIYQATPDVVYVGYTPGYLGAYAWNGAVVYGTGYVYAPYYSPRVYYPRPFTWGFGASYNPYSGWGYGVGVSTGFLYFGTRWGGGFYRPAWRPAYGGGWYGAGGFRRPPPRPAGGGWYGGGYHPAGAGNRGAYGGAGFHARASLYQRPTNANAVVGARPAGGASGAAGPARPTAGASAGAQQPASHAGAEKPATPNAQNRPQGAAHPQPKGAGPKPSAPKAQKSHGSKKH